MSINLNQIAKKINNFQTSQIEKIKLCASVFNMAENLQLILHMEKSRANINDKT